MLTFILQFTFLQNKKLFYQNQISDKIRSYQYDCLTTLLQSNDKIVFAKLAPGTGKSLIIYKLYTKLDGSTVVKTEKHLVHQLQKQFEHYSQGNLQSQDNFQIQDNFLTPTNTKYLIIDEFKESFLKQFDLKKYSKVFCFNCWYPEKIKIDFDYPIKQAVKDQVLCDYQVIKDQTIAEIQKNPEIHKGLIVISKHLKINNLEKYSSEKRFMFLKNQTKFMYITSNQIEGLSLPFIDAIIYHPQDFDEYQKIQIIGRVLRKDPKNKRDKIAKIFEV